MKPLNRDAVVEADLRAARWHVERLRRQVEDIAKTNAHLVAENMELKEALRRVPAHMRMGVNTDEG
jgi:hypothetical protein